MEGEKGAVLRFSHKLFFYVHVFQMFKVKLLIKAKLEPVCQT